MDAGRLITAATAVALSGNGVGGGSGRNFRVGAVLAHKNRIVAAKPNSAKTHRALARFDPFATLHAERATILAHGLDNCDGLTLAVARVLRNGDIALARPCDGCQQLIEAVGIRRVYYTDDAGAVRWYRV